MTILLLSLLGCAPKYPSKPNPHASQELHNLFENHISAMGGRSTFLSKKTLLIKGRIRTMSSPISASFTTIKVAPEQIWTTIKLSTGEERSRGWDGQQGWSGDRLLSPQESLEIQRNAQFYFPLQHSTEFPEAFAVQDTQFGGRPCTVVLAKNSQKEWFELFFDQNSKLLIGYARWKKGEKKHWYRFGHYTNIDGVKHPLSIEEQYEEMHKVILIESLEWNVPDLTIPFPNGEMP